MTNIRVNVAVTIGDHGETLFGTTDDFEMTPDDLLPVLYMATRLTGHQHVYAYGLMTGSLSESKIDKRLAIGMFLAHFTKSIREYTTSLESISEILVKIADTQIRDLFEYAISLDTIMWQMQERMAANNPPSSFDITTRARHIAANIAGTTPNDTNLFNAATWTEQSE